MSSGNPSGASSAPNGPRLTSAELAVLRETLRAFYLGFNAERVSSIDIILEKYVGFEVELLRNLKEKYNVVEYEPFDNLIREYSARTGSRAQDGNSAAEVGASSSSSSSSGNVTQPPTGASQPLLQPPSSSSQPSTLLSTSSGAPHSALAGGMNPEGGSTLHQGLPTRGFGPIRSDGAASAFPQITLGMKDISNVSTTIAGRILSGVNWRLNSMDSTAAGQQSDAKAAENFDVTELQKRFVELKDEVDRLEQERNRLEVLVLSMSSGLKGEGREETVATAEADESSDIPGAPAREVPILSTNYDHAMEVLQDRLDANVRLEKQLTQMLRGLDLNKIASPAAAAAVAPRRKSSPGIEPPISPPTTFATTGAATEVGDASTPATIGTGMPVTGFEGRSMEDLSMEIVMLRGLVGCLKSCLLTSLTKSSSDYFLNAQKRDEDRLQKVQAMDSQVAKLSELLSLDWSSLDALKRELNDVNRQLDISKKALRANDAIIAQSYLENRALQEKFDQLEKELCESLQSRETLAQLCSEKIRNIEQHYQETVQQAREGIALEREDALSQLASVADMQHQWQATVSSEAQTEILRLRSELAKSRRQEAQREREVAYLQRQLSEAAKQLAQYVVESEAAERPLHEDNEV